MEHNQSKEIRFSESILREICDLVADMAKTPLRREELRQNITCENLMLRAYLSYPEQSYSQCRKAIQSFCPEYRLEDGYIRERAEIMHLSEKQIRADLALWAKRCVAVLCDGMAGNSAAIGQAREMIRRPYTDRRAKPHPEQIRMVLFALFEQADQLRQSEAREMLLRLGPRYCRFCLNKIFAVIAFDTGASEVTQQLERTADRETLIREIFLARRELQEYKELVEAADSEFENKLEELKQQEFSSFFAALNNGKYGYIIDTVYLLSRACAELKKSGGKLPYSLEGIPALLDRFLCFLRDAGITPACKYPPHSEQRLTLAQMEGCHFEPHPDRNKPIGEGERIKVKVLSSGWKYGETVISYPVLQEDYTDNKHN